MKVRVAYIEEPPFYWTGPHQTATGADIELADVTLRAIGASVIEFVPTTFDELLPGVQEGRWDMNVPLFVSAERAQSVAFSVPVWALGDGFVVRQGNPKALSRYEDVASRSDALLGLVAGTVQRDTAMRAGVPEGRIVAFKRQSEAVAALIAGEIDAYTATAVGNREIVGTHRALEAVAHDVSGDGNTPVGAFSFRQDNEALLRAVNHQLRQYLGSADHRARMAKYGITTTEIDGALQRGA
ncbi:transporter substrate-binding domain-containing protein [Pandoraea fibrosis]|uniref:Amino acid ABC transporter substrate-binding protein n=1 Tax=Pandoraea fibrosis TaxID=1891094 RepID=A0A5E4S475_9BURK|nr:transporter substrate-binding domain-containing protein [Pandoraea fibrosis]QHE92585.1 transporter substrate-binding domain-containing protein [Pandoraea fibrosis]QHF13859.1 transporter substrate-binding domain-containing protein [Pandoraea fibrosis]VVD69384.1 amino acid ABC transporter substrate-binding protein [Pandoraea fibrosis]